MRILFIRGGTELASPFQYCLLGLFGLLLIAPAQVGGQQTQASGQIRAGEAGPISSFETDPAEQWFQWRGPFNNGVAPKNAKPPIEWSDSENILWKVQAVGEGISTPIVWEQKVFMVSAVETDRVPEDPPKVDSRARTSPPAKIFEFMVWCHDLNTGKLLWKKKATEAAPIEGRHSTSTYAAASPVTDGKRLIASFGSYGVFCFDLDGKLKWKRDLGDMRTRRGWGEAVSPVLFEGKVIVNWDQEDQSHIFVLDANDGKTIWEKKRDEPTTWATPICVKRDGKTQLITNGTNRVRSYNLADGEIVWESTGTTLNAIPTPVLFEDKIICMAGYRGNRAFSVDIDSSGKVDDSKLNWEIRRSTPYVPSPLLSGERLYFTAGNFAVLNCINAKTGKAVFETTRLPGQRGLYASPIAADGRVYLPSREGVVLVFADDDEFKVLATNKMDDAFDASPVAVGPKLLLRGRKFLYCIETKKQ